MTTLVFFLEELSAKAMLEQLLPRILPETVACRYIPFEGKQDLEKQLPIKLRGWQTPDCHFIILRDQDSGDCYQIKSNLQGICHKSGKADTLIRIACRELESWYLGDLQAVEDSLGIHHIAKKQGKKRYRNPDLLNNAKEELKKLCSTHRYQEVRDSRAIGKHLNPDNNKSPSFRTFIEGVRSMLITTP